MVQQQQQVASQDSNDDDGETSSASEDSALSGSYPSPSRSKTRVPGAKTLEPTIVFGNELSKRTRLHPDSQPKWSPATDSNSAAGIFRTSGNTPVRQLPRMAALETFQQPPLKHPQQQPQLNQGNHHQIPDRPRPSQHQLQQPPPPPQFDPSQESCHLPAVGSHGHGHTSGMLRAAPMQLPRLPMIRTPVQPVAPPLASIGPAARVPASSPSPGMPPSGSSSPALSFNASINASLAAGPRYSRESYQSRQVSYVEAETRVPLQLPSPHTSSSTSNNSGLGGALARPWLSRDEGECLRQVPRIEALSGDEPPLPAMHGARVRWAPIWSTPAQHHSEPYDHHPAVETGFSGGNDIHGHTWRNPECARRDGANRDWLVNVGSYQSRPPPGMEEACQPMRPIQQHVKVSRLWAGCLLDAHDSFYTHTYSTQFSIRVYTTVPLFLLRCLYTNCTAMVKCHVCVLCVCYHLIYFGRQNCGRTSQGHTGGRSHRISHPPSFCGAYLNFYAAVFCTLDFKNTER